MITIISVIYFIYVLVKIYVSIMEIGYVSRAKNEDAVILSSSNYIKAAEYKIKSERMNILSSLVDYAVFLFWIGFGLKFLENLILIDDVALKSVLFVLIFIIINYLFSLPFDIYKSFVLDKKFGFSNMSVKLFLSDMFKSFLIFLIVGSFIVWSVSKIILHFDSWWLYGFIFLFLIVLVINVIYPTLIAPIFNKFKVLNDEELKDSIEELFKKVGLKSNGVFTIDASKRDNRLNAYFGGLGKSKRVVLFDTLVKKLTKNELLAVLGHELGHFKNRDILKNIATMGIMLFVMFYIFGHLPNSLFEALGVSNEPYMIIALFMIFAPILSFFMMPIFGLISRANEYKADEFGVECESKEALISALKKLANENKSFPLSHPLNIFFYHTHPPLVERLKRLQES